jgi:hypothetical protein
MSALRKEQPITDAVKLAEVRKEVEYRWFVYPKRVAAGKMKQAEMDRRIAVMRAVMADYEAKVEGRLL